MDRLTHRRLSDNAVCPNCTQEDVENRWGYIIQAIADKLCDYEDAEERGELVRVVRCKDCKHCVTKTIQGIFKVGNWCDAFNFSTQPEHYCALAEAALAEREDEPQKCDTCSHGAHWDGVVVCDRDAQRHERTDGCERGECK